MRLTFGYSDSEDRIWLSSSDGRKFWLTRRMLANILAPAADLLEKTVPGAILPNALPPAERIALEHSEALADTPEGEPAMQRDLESHDPQGQPPSPPILVNSITLSANPQFCQLTLVGGGRQHQIELNRLDFHRLLGALILTTQNAEWQLPVPAWLRPADSSTSPVR